MLYLHSSQNKIRVSINYDPKNLTWVLEQGCGLRTSIQDFSNYNEDKVNTMQLVYSYQQN